MTNIDFDSYVPFIDVPLAEHISTPAEAEEAIAYLKQHEFIGLDTETTGLDILRDKVVMWSMSTLERRFAIDVSLLNNFAGMLLNSEGAYSFVFHNAKFDLHMLYNMGLPLGDASEIWHDTLLMLSLLNSTESRDLKSVSAAKYNMFLIDYKELLAQCGVRGNIALSELESMSAENKQKVIDYASKDAWLTLKLFYDLKKELEGIKASSRMKSMYDYYLFELSVQRVLFNMERSGVFVDKAAIEKAQRDLLPMMQEKELNLICYAKNPNFNIRSTQQLSDLFTRQIGVPEELLSKTKTGQISMDEPTLARFVEHNVPYAKDVLDYRKMHKISETYLAGFYNNMCDQSRVHTTYTQYVAVTGRLSSRSPNLQNIQKKAQSHEYVNLRSIFCAPSGKVLVDTDYDQIEVKVAAVLCKASELLKIILEGKDVHAANAALIFKLNYGDIVAAKNKPAGELTQYDISLLKMRTIVKPITFGVLYGMTALSLSKDPTFSGTLEDAERLLGQFYEIHHEIYAMKEKVIDFVLKTGYVTTYFGRRRYFPKIPKPGVYVKDTAKFYIESDMGREAFNTIIQGTAAEIMKMAMVSLFESADFKKLGGRIVLQVHDELLVECPEDRKDEAAHIIQSAFESVDLGWPIRLTASPSIGYNWSDIH